MQLIFALIGGFFQWLFQFRKKRRTFNEIVWGHKYDVDLFNYKIESVYFGFIICVIVLIIVASID